jgi:hypothetical protein
LGACLPRPPGPGLGRPGGVAHVYLARYRGGDQGGTVFLQALNGGLNFLNHAPNLRGFAIEVIGNGDLLGVRRKWDGKRFDNIRVQVWLSAALFNPIA